MELFDVDRIELDDCLSSVQTMWIITEVSVISFAVVTFIMSMIVLRLMKKIRAKHIPYNRLSRNSGLKSTQLPSSSNGLRTPGYKNTSSPFEEVEL